MIDRHSGGIRATRRVDERGTSLVESLVAIVILSVGCLSLSRVMLDAVYRDREAAGASYQSGLLRAELGRVLVAPPAEGAATSCRVDSLGPMPFSVCIAPATTPAYTQQITVSVTPSAVVTRLRGDSAMLELALPH